jgi:signal transduction histidine kinase
VQFAGNGIASSGNMFKGVWGLLRLRTIIAVQMLLAVLAVELLNAIVFFLMPARLITIYSAHWLVAKGELAALVVFEANAEARGALCASLEAGTQLHISWQPARSEVQRGPNLLIRPYLERVRGAIEAELNGKVKKVTVKDFAGTAGNLSRVELQFQPPDFVKRLSLTPFTAGDDDFVIPETFEYAIQGLDGSWIVIEPKGPPNYTARLAPWLAFLFGAVSLVYVLSAIMARRPLRHLERLAEAAHDFGRTREMKPIPPAVLYEHRVIAEAITGMQERIKRFIAERTRMLAAISHDLRTNLTGSRLYSEELSDSEAKRHIVENMEEMERMISATLAFAGDELKGEQMQRADIAAMLISLCDSYSDLNRDATYDGPNHLSATCQPVALKRVFTNLIDNAIKYGDCARVRLWQSSGRVEISIADTGPGIPEAQHELAFQPFCRLNNSRGRKAGGVGLGLAIAREIVQAHGGEITLGQPPEGTGLQVRIWLPLPHPALVSQ